MVLTGATGSLGSYILDELLADPAVETVYCLCRAKNDANAADRLAASMKARKLLTRFLGANERVVALAADLPALRLGLDDERYRVIANRATVIIHVRTRSYLACRRLTFGSSPPSRTPGQSISTWASPGTEGMMHTWHHPAHPPRYSFESHIRGAVNLMRLALSSPRSQPAKFFFSSSISAVANWPGPGLVPEAVTDNPAVAQEIG